MRKEKPTGREIAEMAKKMRAREDVVKGMKNGKSIKFQPADMTHLKDLDEFEDGQVIGVLENELGGDETKLPPGKHNIFLSKIDGVWHVFAESQGEIAGEAARVEVTYHRPDERKSTKGQFYSEGWCIGICILSILFGLICVVEIQFCF